MVIGSDSLKTSDGQTGRLCILVLNYLDTLHSCSTVTVQKYLICEDGVGKVCPDTVDNGVVEMFFILQNQSILLSTCLSYY